VLRFLLPIYDEVRAHQPVQPVYCLPVHTCVTRLSCLSTIVQLSIYFVAGTRQWPTAIVRRVSFLAAHSALNSAIVSYRIVIVS